MSTALDRAREAAAVKRAAGISIERLDPIAKARRHPSSLRLAINGKCWDCVGGGADPNPRGSIRDCRISDCTLWTVRPYQTGEQQKENQS